MSRENLVRGMVGTVRTMCLIFIVGLIFPGWEWWRVCVVGVLVGVVMSLNIALTKE